MELATSVTQIISTSRHGLWCKFHERAKLRAGVNVGSGNEDSGPNLRCGFAPYSKLI